MLDEKNAEIAQLKVRLLSCTLPSGCPPSPRSSGHFLSASRDTSCEKDEVNVTPLLHQRGKAPPVEPFSAEDMDEHWDEWLPTFERAAEWNSWTDAERLIQLAGHLRGKARQEFSLLTPDEKSTFAKTKISMRGKLEVESKALAAQDFRHSTQGTQESVSDYIL